MGDCSTTERQRTEMARALEAEVSRISAASMVWLESRGRCFEEMEQEAVRLSREFGRTLLSQFASVVQPAYAPPEIICECGQPVAMHGKRRAQVKTLMGDIQIERPYYWCRVCGHGEAPLDRQIGIRAGSTSGGLNEVLALLGTQEAFDEAAEMVEKLTGTPVSANLVRRVTEAVGMAIETDQDEAISRAWESDGAVLPPVAEKVPDRLYISMDGTMANIREQGWKEMRVGAVYATQMDTTGSQQTIRATDITFHVDLNGPEYFGKGLWLEAYRRGITKTREVVAIGDGAHWIWNLVGEHFPGAIQIVDWYHATEYIWKAAHALFEESDLATPWANECLDHLWQGRVQTVIDILASFAPTNPAVEDAITYYTNNRLRMRYPEFRAHGLQIGSGTIESACRHVLGLRLKQSGMRWSAPGARRVAKVRAALRSGRWPQALALYNPPPRSYHRLVA